MTRHITFLHGPVKQYQRPVSEAKKKSELLLKNNIVKLLGRSDVNTQLVRYLWWDLRHFVSHGDDGAAMQ